VQTQSVNYDQVASEYAAHRQVHSGVFRELCVQGCLSSGSVVLEVGCGTGNYIRALTGHFGCTGYGLDPSAAMLTQARTRRASVAWVQARAEGLGVAGAAFDLIFSVDVIHHVADQASFYHEAARALRSGGRVCTVTDSADIIRRREILSGYFPETVQIELARYPRIAQLEAWMAAAGLPDFQIATVEEPYEITSAQPFHDRAYSSLHLIPEAAWRGGLEQLERDLARGPVRGASRYACVWGRKPVRLVEGLDRAT
jgi:ubiquinone/menaquinone biosynthesis C-methylase UbiE